MLPPEVEVEVEGNDMLLPLPEVEGNDMLLEVEGNDMSLPPEVEVELEGNDMSLPPEVEGNDMSAKSWRINLEEFPALTESRDAEHGSCTLCRFLRTPSKPSSQSLCM